MEGHTDVLRRGTCGIKSSLFNATPHVEFLTPLIPNPNPIPTKWMEYNPIKTKCTLTLTSQCWPHKGGQTDRKHSICGGIKKNIPFAEA